MTDWLADLVYNSLTWLIGRLDGVSYAIYLAVYNIRLAYFSARDGVMGAIIFFFTSVVPDWFPFRDGIKDILLSIIAGVFIPIGSIFDWAFYVFWDNRDFEHETWTWITPFVLFREDLVYTIRHMFDGVSDLVDSLLTQLRDWVDALLQGVRDWFGALLQGVRDWVNAVAQSIRDWAAAGFSGLVLWVEGIAQGIRDWQSAIWATFQDWVGATIDGALGGIRSWIADAQLSLDWIRVTSVNLQAFLDHPLDWLWVRIERDLWPKVELWLIKVWDGVF